jgi:hypothetical protein
VWVQHTYSKRGRKNTRTQREGEKKVAKKEDFLGGSFEKENKKENGRLVSGL